MVLLVIGALGPANWTPRTPLGWQITTAAGSDAGAYLVDASMIGGTSFLSAS